MKKIRLLGLSAILLTSIAGGCKKDKAVNCNDLIKNFTEAVANLNAAPSEENCIKATNAAKALLQSECVSEEVRESARNYENGCPA